MKHLLIFITIFQLLFSIETEFIDFTQPEFNDYSLFKKQKGQPTWLVSGIYQIEFGEDLPFKRNYNRYSKNWPEILPFVLKRKPIYPSIAVWSGLNHGHIAYVEHIDFKKNKDDDLIYFREANYPLINNKIDKYDGLLKVLKYKRFKNRIKKFRGFLDLNEFK